MKTTSRLTSFIFVTCLSLTLAACQNGDERAEEHYQSALALMAAGDLDRARVEFLNVFNHNGQHREARADFAAMQRERGELQESYSQYLRLVEQYPDHADGRIALAEMALEIQNWEEARRHGRTAQEVAPEDPRVVIITAYLTYLEALEEEDAPARRAAFDAAQGILAETPENLLLLRLSIDHMLREGDLDGALAAVDLALEGTPDSRLLNDVRLSVLIELEEVEAVETHLLAMLERFPEDEELPSLVLRYYLSLGEAGRAVAFLRTEAEEASDDTIRQDALVALVQLILETEGPQAALAELDRVLDEGVGSAAIFGALRASIRFTEGETESALAELEDILAGDLSAVEAGRVRVSLARMLVSTGNVVGARAQVEQVLEADPGQPDALKMQAAWLIEGDEADRAIGLLRLALETNPDDVQALSLMADAHARNGNRVVAQDFMALAVDASNAAPAETLRYAQALIGEESYLAAEEMLINALRLSPGNLELMSVLGNLYIRMEDWPRAEQVETTLREDGDEARTRVADGLQASRLAAQGRMEDAVRFLENLASAEGGGDINAQIAVVRARLSGGDVPGALAFVETLVSENPDQLAYRFALAATQSAAGDLVAAEATFRSLTVDAPQAQQAWIGLIRSLNGLGRPDEAEQELEAALAVLPEALDLLWAQASFREWSGNIDGAIEIYELMYARAPGAEVIANNLASLLATYRDDEESLDRAWSVARRLRGIEFPPFQDTYGWIAYRRGEYEEALEHLEPAAAGLPTDPLVRFHLAMTRVALGDSEGALVDLRQAVELAGPEDTRAQFDIARAEITRIEAELAAEAAQSE